MEDRMRIMNELIYRKSTHNCPSCGGPAYCAMEAGKSPNLCWCMSEERDGSPLADAEECLCKKCLTYSAV